MDLVKLILNARARKIAHQESVTESVTDSKRRQHPAEIPIAGGHCYLLTIAPELRNRIYQYALSSATGEVAPRLYLNQDARSANTFDFTLTCKEIHAECGRMGYHLNTIVFNLNKEELGYLPNSTGYYWSSGENEQRLAAARGIIARHLSTRVLRKVRFKVDYYDLFDLQNPLRSLYESGAELQITTQTLALGVDPSVSLTFTISKPEETEAEILGALPGYHWDFHNRILRAFWPDWALRNGL